VEGDEWLGDWEKGKLYCTIHGSISVSYRQQYEEEVINTQDIQIYSVKYYKHFTKAVLLIIITNKKIHLYSEWSVYVDIFK